MDLSIGSTIGDYQVIDILGAGGMGKVYKVRNVISDRVEAMKVLLPDLSGAPDLADRFQREIKLQASLVHPNITQLHTAVRVDNQLLMVMEFVEGQPFDRLLSQGPLPVPAAVEAIAQVLAALEFAHARGVVHRDIKPGNMMRTPDGTVKLMDFGIARAAADQKLTMTGMTVGSAYYMSPEQIRGAANLDGRADLYSVGVTLYELVTGKRPFDGDSQYAIMQAHLEKVPVPPIELDPKLPRELNDVILLAVAKNPDERFQSAAAFRNALLHVKAMLEPAAAPPAARPVAAAPASRRWLWMTCGGAAAAVAIVCAIQFAPRKSTQAARPAQQAAVQPAQPAASPADPARQPDPPPQPTPAEQPAGPVPATEAPAKAAHMPPLQAPPPAPSKHETPVQAGVQPVASQPQPVPPPVAAQPAAVQPVSAPPGPTRAEIAEARDRVAKLEVRGQLIHQSLDSLRNSMAAQGLSLNARFTGPQALMDTNLRSAREALGQSDLNAAREYSEKAEHQIEILEKLLNL